MPHFDIVRKNDPEVTFRTSKLQADFDIKFSHSDEHFVGDIDIPQEWHIGVIVGGVWHRKNHHSAGTVWRSVCETI